jgi:hypothetical protein
MIHRGPRGGQWNSRWWEELGPDPKKVTVDDVVRIREKLVREFALEDYRP